MALPRTFYDMCRNFNQDADLANVRDLYSFVLDGLRSDEVAEIHRFLIDLGIEQQNDEHLEQMWSSTPADFHFTQPDHRRRFLITLRDRTAP